MTSKARQLASEPNQQQAGRRNLIINGDFDVWQRGTGAFTASGAYTADRYLMIETAATVSVSRQSFTLGQTDVPNNPKYYMSTAVTTASGATDISIIGQKIEGVNTFAGETATLSFWAKADASKDMYVEFNQYVGTGGSPSGSANGVAGATVSLTTSWTKHTLTVDIPSISGKTLGTDGNDSLEMFFWLNAGSNFDARTNSLGNQSGTFDIAQVQLEAGSVATPFEHRSFGEELALCQRYYEKSFQYSVAPASDLGDWRPTHGTEGVIQFKVPKRANPTMTSYRALGTGSNWDYFTGSWNSSATNISSKEKQFTYYLGTNALYAVSGHWAADAEL